MLFTVDKLTVALSLLVILGQNQPGATDNPGLSVCFMKSRWLWGLCALLLFWHLPCILYWRHPVFMPELVILHQLPFKACFHLLKCFLLSFPFIFRAPPPPRRAKAQRIANSPFPHLTSICRRGERQPWKFNSAVCQFHGPTGGPTANTSCHPSLHVGIFAPLFLSIKHNLQTFLLEKHFFYSFSTLTSKTLSALLSC